MNITNFNPYTNKEAGFNTIVPEGWIERRPGEFSRGEPETDPTFLAQLGVPGATIEFVIELLLPKLSLVALPERTGGIENMNLIWDLYTSEIQVPEMGKMTLEMALKKP